MCVLYYLKQWLVFVCLFVFLVFWLLNSSFVVLFINNQLISKTIKKF